MNLISLNFRDALVAVKLRYYGFTGPMLKLTGTVEPVALLEENHDLFRNRSKRSCRPG